MNDRLEDTPIARLDPEIDPPPALRERVERSLRRRGLLAEARPSWWRTAAAVAAGILLLASGYGLGVAATHDGARPAVPAPSSDPGYMLLLFEDDGYDPGVEVSAVLDDYTEWVGSVRRSGIPISGEALRGDEGVVLEPGDPVMPEALAWGPLPEDGSPHGQLSGFFLLTTQDRTEALAIARSCPHLRYGGRIVVRPIYPT